MKKKYNTISCTLLLSLLSLTFFACQPDDKEFGEIIAPSNLVVSFEIVGVDNDNPNGDGTGFVNFSAVADNGITYTYYFGDGRSEVAPSGNVTHRYSDVGLNTYTLQVVASGTGGVTTSTVLDIDVFSAFDDPISKSMLTGANYDEELGEFTEDASKTWYWSADRSGHLGLGPAYEGVDGDWWYAKWFVATPFEKDNPDDPNAENSRCIYTDELTFSLTEGQLTFELNNNGQTFFNGAYESVVGGSAGEDYCYNLDTSGSKLVALAPADSGVPLEETTNTSMTFSDDGFMGYYIGATTYEILSITDDLLVVRAIQGNNPVLAWYHIFTTEKPVQEEASLDVEYTTEVWSDEFDTNGAPDATKWNYDIGTGSNGWGNNESQYYTDRSDNVIVEDGVLKIHAKAESFSGSNYTSSRLKTQDLFEFTYGRIDVRAKLPSGGGTWPAIWMLGANFDVVGWPTCGEIDIMEHVGNNIGVVSNALHTPSSFGNTINVNETEVGDDVVSEFHVYSVNWSANQISFLIDDEIVYTYAPVDKTADNWPFTADQFIILNVAMGGTLGGTIDAGFTESTMEIDYVRVFQ